MKKRWAGINCMLRIEEILRRQACAFSQPTSAEEVLSKWKPRRKKIDGRRAGEEEVMNQRNLKQESEETLLAVECLNEIRK